jgi:hypothetical protein
MQIVQARPRDAEALTRIAINSKRRWGYPESWIQIWVKVLTTTPEFIQENETYAVVIESRIAGFHALGVKGDRLEL